MKYNPVDLLLESRGRLLFGHWGRGREIRRRFDGEYEFCAVGSVRWTEDGRRRNNAATRTALGYLDLAVAQQPIPPNVPFYFWPTIQAFNDFCGTRKEDVLALFDDAIRLAKDGLS